VYRLEQQLLRERARARAELPDLAGAGRLQRLAQLHGQGAAEQRRHLRRRHEIAPGRGHLPELARVVGVVAQARRVQRHRHEAIERQPAAGAPDFRRDELLERAPYTGCLRGHARIVRQ
jgi:hypothetical protein